METGLKTLKKLLLLTIVFLFPLFFLPLTQEFFITNKLYLLAFGSLLLLLISTLELLISKKFVWQKTSFDTTIFLIVITAGLSILISSPNKIQALVNPNFGLVMIASLLVLYIYLSRQKTAAKEVNHLTILSFSSLFLSIITIVFFFQPLKNADLPLNLRFLKNPFFTPMGNLVDLAIFFGFFVVYGFSQMVDHGYLQSNQTEKKRFYKQKDLILSFSLLTLNLIALLLVIYTIVKPPTSTSQLQKPIILPPSRISWYAAVETLKSPLTALFGVGIDNYSSIFTRVKDFAYNQSDLWRINSFAVSRSALLHVFTETGIFGLIALGLLLIALFRKKTKSSAFTIFYLLLVLLLFPPSLPLFFLLFITLAFVEQTTKRHHLPNQEVSVDLKNLPPVYVGMIIIFLLFIGGSSYLLGRAYAAEVFFKRSLDGLTRNNAKDLYDNQRQAVILNPYIERFRINFAQTNLLIANNIAAKAGSSSDQKNKKKQQLSQQDQQNIAQAIQAAIAEAKASVALNPQKASNWANLAEIYRNVLNIAQGADVWTISSYQRAIIADPQNPNYRINLGGVYYSLGNYDQAIKLFEQTVSIKPDLANGHYNLAWAHYQKGDYQQAVNIMQNVLNLLDPKTAKTDYQKAKKDLEEFKKKLPPEQQQEATPSSEKQPPSPSQLTLPTPPTATFEPKIKLPKEASPETKLRSVLK